MGVLSLLCPYFVYQVVAAVCGFIAFLLRGTCAALADLWIMYVRVGSVWRQPRRRQPSLVQGDLVMQLATHSPAHSRVCGMDALLHLNAAFIDRGLWRGLSEPTAAPSVIVTGVSYGGIGFYTALHVLLAGANVHGIVRSAETARETELELQRAVERQCGLHKDWAGKVGRIMLHTCDLSDTIAVAQLADKLLSDPNLRVVVCNAGPMCPPLSLSPQRLDEQFAAHHVGHSLLVLRLLQNRLTAHRRGSPARRGTPGGRDAGGDSAEKSATGAALGHACTGASPAPWRIIITTSAAAATADPSEMTTFHRYSDAEELSWHTSRFSGYGNASMCQLLFAFALARFVASDRHLHRCCTVNVLHPGPTLSRAVPKSKLPLGWLLDGEVAALLRMTPVIASLFVTDLCLSRRYEQTTGHFFRMGEDQSEREADIIADPALRKGLLRNSALWPGIPGPRVSLSERKQDWLWNGALNYFESHGLLEANLFR